MSYIGNTPTQQNFVAGADQFSGNGSTVAFTLSRSVNTVFDIFVTVANVPQDPFTAYTVSGNTLTFDGAPPSGTNNIDVVYRATNVQTFVPSPGVSQQFAIGTAAAPGITFIGDTNTGIFSPAADTWAVATGGTEALRVNSSQNVGIGTTSITSIFKTEIQQSTTGSSNLRLISPSSKTSTTTEYPFYITSSEAWASNPFGLEISLKGNATSSSRVVSISAVTVNSTTDGILALNPLGGNVGIGTTSPTNPLQVNGNIVTTDGTTVNRMTRSGGVGLFGTTSNHPIAFQTNDTERARITEAGALCVGVAGNTENYRTNIQFAGSASNGLLVKNTASSGGPAFLALIDSAQTLNNTGDAAQYQDSTTQRWTLRKNGGLANFQANNVNLSDRREKTNFAPAKDYLDVICAIPVQTFNYIDQAEDDPGLTLGVVAQDVEAVAPELVSESDWSAEKDGSKMRLSIYQTDLQYALMKCIQELKAELDATKAKVAALENA